MPVTLTVQVVSLSSVSTANLRLRLLDALTSAGEALPLVIGLIRPVRVAAVRGDAQAAALWRHTVRGSAALSSGVQ